jgi:hypothetical protein
MRKKAQIKTHAPPIASGMARVVGTHRKISAPSLPPFTPMRPSMRGEAFHSRRVQKPLPVAQEREIGRLHLATQFKNAARLEHSLGAIRIDHSASRASQGQTLSHEEREKKTSQREFVNRAVPAVQEKAEPRPNLTWLPDKLKTGVENFSGLPLDDVRVHYNSSKPAQLNALAYAQGTEIYVAPGQERHLAHEAWHIVQQAHGRVRPTIQPKDGVPVNDDSALEHEANLMGKRALQTRDEDAGMQNPPPLSSSTFQKFPQRRALSVGAAGARSRSQTLGGTVVQLVPGSFLVGSDVRSKSDVEKKMAGGEHTLSWSSTQKSFKKEDYAGSVYLALTWGLQGSGGTAGWYGRKYPAAAFHDIGTEAQKANECLAGMKSLNNDKNKTLVAIRAFRGPNSGEMAQRTVRDLFEVYVAVSDKARALFYEKLIKKETAEVFSIEADPAEAHPNTLPTAKITFDDKSTVYFKGRGPAVENALVGSDNSAAQKLTSLTGTSAADVGMHRFVEAGRAGEYQIAEDVGAEVPPALSPRGFLGEAVAAWLSAAKSALLVSLTATTDLHEANIKVDRFGKSHIIDAEFLLDFTEWRKYTGMLNSSANHIENFKIKDFVPSQIKEYTRSLSPKMKIVMADAVEDKFMALQGYLNDILRPIEALIATRALLRVIPFGTAKFLGFVTEFHNAANEPGQDVQTVVNVVDRFWNKIVGKMSKYRFKIDNNVTDGKVELCDNLRNGMVPLFHVRASDGVLLLNKKIEIGKTVFRHGVANLLKLTRIAVNSRYKDMAAIVRAEITG